VATMLVMLKTPPLAGVHSVREGLQPLAI
jgi:hypothetical protein